MAGTKDRTEGVRPWEMPFEAWVDVDAVVTVVPPTLKACLERSVARLETLHLGLTERGLSTVGTSAPSGPFVRIEQDVRDDLVFVVHHPDTLLVVDGVGALLGGVENGNLWVHPERRGDGIATAMHVVVGEADLPIMRHPVAFSEGGFATRVSAHRELCLRAARRGCVVHPDNEAAYVPIPSPGS